MHMIFNSFLLPLLSLERDIHIAVKLSQSCQNVRPEVIKLLQILNQSIYGYLLNGPL